MSDILVSVKGRAGRLTLNRPKALNAVTYEMVTEIHAALDAWRHNNAVDLVIIDAVGDKAFSAGGDIADLYASGIAQDYGFGQTFWRDEYHMNAALHNYEKPVVSFLQGFTMGGGMGVGCHGSHRVVGESSQIAMPECGIGLVPDVGGSMILANAPGHVGAYLGTTGARMNADDAIYAGFADMFISEAKWPALIAALEDGADLAVLTAASTPAEGGTLAEHQAEIDASFGALTLPALEGQLEASDTEFAKSALKALRRGAPLSMAVTLQMMADLKGNTNIRDALVQEYRFTARAMEHGDFIEGVRAAIIDKDRKPKWKHTIESLSEEAVSAMRHPLGPLELTF